jgi:hypothetical protein
MKFEQEKATANLGPTCCKIPKKQTQFWQICFGLGSFEQTVWLCQRSDL